MTFANGLRSRIATSIARRRMFRRTYDELSNLSSRELEDLGLSRWDISRTARKAAYGE